MSSDNETTSTDESYDWETSEESTLIDSSEIETYEEHVSYEENDIPPIDIIEKEALEYIEHIAGRFTYLHRKYIQLDDLPRYLWNAVLKILRDNFNNSDYNIVLCKLMNHNIGKKINRVFECIELFLRPKELAKYDKYRYLHCAEIVNINKLKLTNANRDKYDMSHNDYMKIHCRDIIVKRIFDSVNYSVIPDMENPCHLWGCIPTVAVNVAIETTLLKLSNDIFLNNLVKFMEFFSFVSSNSYYENYKYIRIIMRDNKTWKICKNLFSMPYLFRMEKTLKELGFPSVATRYIREYLERTWLNTDGKGYIFFVLRKIELNIINKLIYTEWLCCVPERRVTENRVINMLIIG